MEGIIDTLYPVLSQLKKKPLVHSCYFTTDIYSNERFFKDNFAQKLQQNYKNPSINIAPYMRLKDFEKPEINANVYRNVNVDASSSY